MMKTQFLTGKRFTLALIAFVALVASGCNQDEIGSLPEAAACTGSTTSIIADPGFEDGNLAISWNPQNFAISGGLTLYNYFPPTEGSSAMVFDMYGAGPGTMRISQDIPVAICATALAFDYGAGVENTPNLGQTLTAMIEPAGGGAPLQSNLILTIPDFVLFSTSGMNPGGVPLKSFRGRTVRIVFEMELFGARSFIDPSFVELDNIRTL